MASSQERFWGLQDSPSSPWQGRPKVGIRVPRFSLPCPAPESPLMGSLLPGWPFRASLALPDMDLGSYDRLQPSPYTTPSVSTEVCSFLRQVGAPSPAVSHCPMGPRSFRDPQLSSLAPTVRQTPCSQSAIVWVGEHSNHNTQCHPYSIPP